MAVLRATQLWLDYIAPAGDDVLTPLPAEIPELRSTGKVVFGVPPGRKAILRCVTATMSQGWITGQDPYWGFAVFKAGGSKLWIHWETFRIFQWTGEVQIGYSKKWEGTLTLNEHDQVGVYGVSFQGSLDTSGSGMLLTV